MFATYWAPSAGRMLAEFSAFLVCSVNWTSVLQLQIGCLFHSVSIVGESTPHPRPASFTDIFEELWEEAEVGIGWFYQVIKLEVLFECSSHAIVVKRS